MEWNMKAWDIAELESGVKASLASDCSVDLKLGGSGNFSSSFASNRSGEEIRVFATTASPSSSLKRARPPSRGVQVASCLVEGCNSDLSGCREYHRRHKVCELHSKTPIVIVNGLEQRFCQQCSRFHVLVEFDEGKRSCRKRLDGHNRRRRKPQPHALHSANFFSNIPGPRYTLYSEIFPAARPESNWVAVMKAEQEFSYLRDRNPPFQRRGSFPRTYEERLPFPIANSRATETSSCNALLPAMTTTSHGCVNDRLLHDGLAGVLDSELALSLLSSSTGSTDISFGHVVPAGRVPPLQPFFSSLHRLGLPHYTHSQGTNQIPSAGFSHPGMLDEQAGGLLVSDPGDANLRF